MTISVRAALHAAARGAWSLAILLIPGMAFAGPPFRTDDPEPVEYQHLEFYTFTSGTHVSGDTGGVGPAFEFNYGVIPDGQFHIIAPSAFDSPAGGPATFGPGDVELGFKYRFIQEDKDGIRPMVGTFPMVEVPVGDQSRGLGAGHIRVFLPLWVQKSFGDWQTYGGGGYWLNQDNILGDKNYWYMGWLLQRKITDKLVLGGEVYHQTATNILGKDTTGFTLGGVYDVDEHNHLLFSAGRALQNVSETQPLLLVSGLADHLLIWNSLASLMVRSAAKPGVSNHTASAVSPAPR